MAELSLKSTAFWQEPQGAITARPLAGGKLLPGCN